MNFVEVERRSGGDRRHTTVSALWRGAMRPRRHGGRRAGDDADQIVDWHSPRVLAAAIAILGLCVMDGALTILLMRHGATEANPIMALFLPHDLGWFAFVKLALTSIGVAVLAACSRMRLFRTIPGEVFLYVVMLGYLALVTYELELLQLMPSADA